MGHAAALPYPGCGGVEDLGGRKETRALGGVRQQRRVAQRLLAAGIRAAAEQLEHLPVDRLDDLAQVGGVDRVLGARVLALQLIAEQSGIGETEGGR